jgi:hypothetical protein
MKSTYLQLKGTDTVINKDKFEKFLGFLQDGGNQLLIWNYGKIILEYFKKTKTFQLSFIFIEDLPDFTKIEFLRRWSEGLTKLIVGTPYLYNGRDDQANQTLWHFSEREN